MQSSDRTLSRPQSMTAWQKLCRATLLKVLQRLPQGYLVLAEEGTEVERFGSSADTLRAEINVLSAEFYPRLLLGGSIGAGETFADELWDTPDLTAVIRLFARNMTLLDHLESQLSWLMAPVNWCTQWRRRNSTVQAKKNIAAHYDLGNTLYRRFLDDSMMYSAAIYPSPEADLAQAQQNKLDIICRKLDLKPHDHLMEIGTGWGALAIHAAKHYGCQVTTTTISEEQYKLAGERVEAEGLTDQITLLKQDYRRLEGRYNKLVSIEMIEAVGKDFLREFFAKCNTLLTEDGLMLLQSITINEQRYDSYSKGMDFIQKYIFPGGFLPCQSVIQQCLKDNTALVVRDCHDIGYDYARTLKDWQRRFVAKQDELAGLGYDPHFARLWRFYFSYCEGGFWERTISTVQMLMSKPGYRDDIQRI
ncbi:Cyclopropane-fatty-acyl-phospholipid synthase [Saliniradius amylolyticus]|uniref:Cyclopropane-fatty-acyl-phospholipid synthase n=1 Tax=Saliniradius amylolyticus TaxID=2183582 RepID=A0A2S2E4Y4_9ALTE|nr:cyclopropane-fatty-acyl-phospholipid synthase family protein [Saliniradius amylolyticus]AWL12659.1 Cyclopropane-fatty-acyl-phospholipid synthase [Saliniradius amylolyticus]